VKRIESNEYFEAVQAYFAEHRVPDRVYRFLLGTLREDDYKVSEDMLYHSVDTLETTDDCIRFCTGSDCVIVLCSEPKK
jgi:hypothetical protein